MRISLAALGLAAVGIALEPLSAPGLFFCGAAVLTGVAGMVNAVVAKDTSRGMRVGAFAVGAIPLVLAVFFVVVIAIVNLNGGFE